MQSGRLRVIICVLYMQPCRLHVIICVLYMQPCRLHVITCVLYMQPCRLHVIIAVLWVKTGDRCFTCIAVCPYMHDFLLLYCICITIILNSVLIRVITCCSFFAVQTLAGLLVTVDPGICWKWEIDMTDTHVMCCIVSEQMKVCLLVHVWSMLKSHCAFIDYALLDFCRYWWVLDWVAQL